MEKRSIAEHIKIIHGTNFTATFHEFDVFMLCSSLKQRKKSIHAVIYGCCMNNFYLYIFCPFCVPKQAKAIFVGSSRRRNLFI